MNTNNQVSDIKILIDQIDTIQNESDQVTDTLRFKTKYDQRVIEDCIKRSKKSKRNSKIHFGLRKFHDTKKHRTTYQKIKYELEKMQLNAKYHWMIIFLVALDCFCIGIELLVQFVELSLIYKEFHLTKEELFHDAVQLNVSHLLIKQNSSFMSHLFEESSLRIHLIYLETILKCLGTFILGVFIIDFIFKAIFIPMNFFVKVWEFIDAIIVIFSFILNIYLFQQKHTVHSVLGLITLLRLWRITEIINAIVVMIETHNENKVENLYKTIKFLDHENYKLAQKIVIIKQKQYDQSEFNTEHSQHIN